MPVECKEIVVGVIDNEYYTCVGLQQELFRTSPEGYKLLVVYGSTVKDLFNILEKHESKLPHPHIVLLDRVLSDESTVSDNVQALRAKDIPVLVISNSPTPVTTRQAYSAGASGVVHKQRSTEQLVSDIFDVIKGKIIYTKEFALAIKASEEYIDAKLSPREIETLALYSLGYSMNETGDRLDISAGTVKTNLGRIRQKYLKVGRDAEGFANIRRRAYEDGLITYEVFLRALKDEIYNVVDGEERVLDADHLG
ncbi:hypothetical protein AUR04nite_16290 [Glutamicibacter uratoxydans]|uniref:DNA-binding response regulator n=1 Tax=Glutamicibacter uratoxydans TaxID=43667 RepID=A0A4Y4DNB5_GLUUR|nr:LuxR C-terminal-related transcriptional regulator [Glutamicibacter uratoxydans]GED06097.1 hypothetical protein AUR04nite_16290 [Glutamicibacter uratoxydans]